MLTIPSHVNSPSNAPVKCNVMPEAHYNRGEDAGCMQPAYDSTSGGDAESTIVFCIFVCPNLCIFMCRLCSEACDSAYGTLRPCFLLCLVVCVFGAWALGKGFGQLRVLGS